MDGTTLHYNATLFLVHNTQNKKKNYEQCNATVIYGAWQINQAKCDIILN